MLILHVCAHFPVTQTLIKIIIAVASRMALHWGLCRLGPWSMRTLHNQLFCLQATLVITVTNTRHKREETDRIEPELKGRETIAEILRSVICPELIRRGEGND